jgi:hypothetical protein
MNGSLINWHFIRWSASSYSKLEIHYIANGGFHSCPCYAALSPFTTNILPVRNAVATAYYQLDPQTNVQGSQMKVRICAFQYYFVTAIKMLSAAGRKNIVRERTRRFLLTDCMTIA